MSDRAWTGLAEAISAIRAELTAAIDEGAGLRFRAGPVELEFTVDVHTDLDGKVKVRLLPWLGAEGGVGHSAGSAHRLKVVLQPIEPDGADKTIGSRSPGRPE
ncbi:MAG: trypco2 family protein [Catenulispora sp.]